MPIEKSHNYIHLAVGGFEVPGQGDFSAIPDANGDMGENDTAGLDPIFFFHHCFIDYVFWTWQRRHGATQHFTIDPADPGAKYAPPSNDPPNLPPAGADKDAPITVETPLKPFQKPDGSGFFTTPWTASISSGSSAMPMAQARWMQAWPGRSRHWPRQPLRLRPAGAWCG